MLRFPVRGLLSVAHGCPSVHLSVTSGLVSWELQAVASNLMSRFRKAQMRSVPYGGAYLDIGEGLNIVSASKAIRVISTSCMQLLSSASVNSRDILMYAFVCMFPGLRDESGLGRTPLSPTSVTSGYKSDVSYDRKWLFMTSSHFVACRFRPIYLSPVCHS